MVFLVRERSFYKTFFSIAGAIAVQGIITFTVNLADNIMIGAYSQTAMSGVALVNQIHYLMQMISSGIASGVVVLAAQYWGKGEREPIKRIIGMGMKFAAATGLIFTFGTFFFPSQALSVLTNDKEIIAQGVEYLKYICFTYLIFIISNTLILTFRSVETTKIAPITALSSLLVNIALNYVLIFGRFGFPEMGARGAGLATLIARLVELSIVIIYVRFRDKKLKIRFVEWFKNDWYYFKDYVNIAVPVVISSSFWGVGQFAQTAILGHVSASAIAANSISAAIFQIATIFFHASSGAGSVIIGKTIGSGQLEKIKGYSRTLQIIFLLLGIISGILILLMRSFIIDFYTLTPEARELTRTFMLILAITAVGTSYEFPVIAGIVQSGGDTRYALIVDTIFTFLFTLPLAALSAFVFNWSAVVTFIILKADQIIKCLPNGIKVNRYKWVRVLTR
jgi:putative MATE family efflux protein